MAHSKLSGENRAKAAAFIQLVENAIIIWWLSDGGLNVLYNA